MELKQYLLETFRYNDSANRKTLECVRQLPDREECLRFFSHLANSHFKWMARIRQDPAAPQMSWWEPVYSLEELESQWEKSLNLWLDLLDQQTEESLAAEQTFIGYDGGHWTAPLKDIAIQLCYHSIHHRAQIQTIIRAQGQQPPFVDYIGTRYRKLD